MLKTTTKAEVEEYMMIYGALETWLEKGSTFEKIGPHKVAIDPVSRRLIGVSG